MLTLKNRPILPETSNNSVFVLSQHSIYNKIPDHRERHSIHFQENLNNAVRHGAKTIHTACCEFKIDGQNRPMIVTLHDGKPFNSLEEMAKALLPSSSIGDLGCQGSGATLASFLVAGKASNFLHAYASKILGKWRMVGLYLDSEGHKCLTTNLSDWMVDLEPFFGRELLEDFNVIYFDCYQPTSNDQNIGIYNSTDIADYVHKSPEKIFDNINYYIVQNHICVGERFNIKTFNDLMAINDARGHIYKKIKSKEIVNCALADNKFVYHAKNINSTFKQNKINFDATIEITVYPGIIEENSKNLVCSPEFVQNEALRIQGRGSRDFGIPKNNYFLELKHPMNANFRSRINDAPIYYSERFNPNISFILKVPNPSMKKSNDIKEFLEDFPKYKEWIGKENNLENYSRKSYIVTKITINKFNFIKINNVNIPIDDMNIISVIGGLDEYFLVQNRDMARTISEDALIAIEKQNNIEDFREIIKKLFKVDTINRPDILVKIEVDEPNQSLIRFVILENEVPQDTGFVPTLNPGSNTKGYFVDSLGNKIFDKFKIKEENRGHKLIPVENGNYFLYVNELGKFENGNYIKISEQEFVNSPRGEVIPFRDIELSNTFGTYGNKTIVPAKVNIPERDISYKDNNVRRKRKGTILKHIDYIDNFHPCTTPIFYAAGILKLNSNNPLIDSLYRSYSTIVNLQQKLWYNLIEKLSQIDKDIILLAENIGNWTEKEKNDFINSDNYIANMSAREVLAKHKVEIDKALEYIKSLD